MALSASQALPLIAQYESGNQNIPVNPALCPPGQTCTASGYYQIVNGTWQQYAAQVPGASQYPTAMSAPQSVQTQVATAIYNAQGIGPWSSNAPLISAVNSGAGTTSNTTSTAGTSVPTTTTGSTPTASASAPASGFATSFLAPAAELLARGGLIFIGGGLVFIAIVALLWQSKTVRVSAGSLGTLGRNTAGANAAATG